ncbi:MAG: excinuclease ABC subunit B [Spirochaetes bacterium GWF1_31_7]|nr:MAG: excinuclease ABC subunit B [Spirochaetes bacterium GWE1_32_154]OHD50166.1 MAG: excinuclease ABC subunit B [Spirochaetes bacterium GWE2_31_10]OHD52480.1 MAG: excinuclease ABC subunit B [Spirochaetes bacterium GWF1_31_7]HBD94125.1 excinuclease ABC subunit B [Spirochaetia bacterium]HBI38638.1 excinuclease ABC subunit B [Spirochaetia bacterium]
MKPFKIVSEYEPAGDQPQAIERIVNNLNNDMKYQTLLGVTGSGKTFTMAKVIERIQKPTLIVSHNKTLAAQLYREFKDFFPDNAVKYFVSYYDYYQPEAYVASKDLYIEKDSSINEEIDMMRLNATSALMDREDVIIIATVSCIYGLGNPDDYKNLSIRLKTGQHIQREQLLKDLVNIQYSRDDSAFERSNFRVRGDTVDIFPAYTKTGIRISMWGDEIEKLQRIDIVNNKAIETVENITIFPAKHFVTTKEVLNQTVPLIKAEMEERVGYLTGIGRELEARRLRSKTEYDIDMLLEIGYCKGVENYSRYFANRKEGERPSTLIDFFPKDFLMFIDESHVTVPQIGGMYNGDRARKTSLVEYGFRLPSALDNRPLFYSEFEGMINQVVFVTATPRDYERNSSKDTIEQIIRPTGLVDPEIEVRPTEGQIDDLIHEINLVIAKNQRVLITTLTKKMSEDLTEYLAGREIKVKYLHSEIETFERVEIIKGLRMGDFDVLVGINLLREGLDMPEVSLVAIMDADKIGFLRSATALIQTIGRAARNIDGRVIMYADKYSDAMRDAIEETRRRRNKQIEYNEKNNITPKTIIKKVEDILVRQKHLEIEEEKEELSDIQRRFNFLDETSRKKYIKHIETLMFESAKNLEFEKAALLRDEINNRKKEWN